MEAFKTYLYFGFQLSVGHLHVEVICMDMKSPLWWTYICMLLIHSDMYNWCDYGWIDRFKRDRWLEKWLTIARDYRICPVWRTCLVRHVCSLTYDPVEVLLFVDTLSWWNRPNCRFRCSLQVMLVIVISYHHIELANAKFRIALRMLKLPKKIYNASTNSWITSRICALYLIQLDKEKWVLKIKKNPAFHWSLCCWLKEHVSQDHKSCVFPR